jgi:DNA-binding beta-propeller fold protein YncE
MALEDGILHHVAGTGRSGRSGDGGPARDAQLNGPKGIAVDRNGHIFVADSENNAIRRIDARTKTITTIELGTVRLNQPHGICAAADGSLFIGDTSNHRVWRVR